MHDWLVVYSGSERVTEQLLKIFPQADLFVVVEFLPDELNDFIGERDVRTTFIQNLPGARRHYRGYLPLMPLAIEQLDLSAYDLVLSSSHAVANDDCPENYDWQARQGYDRFCKEAGLTPRYELGVGLIKKV